MQGLGGERIPGDMALITCPYCSSSFQDGEKHTAESRLQQHLRDKHRVRAHGRLVAPVAAQRALRTQHVHSYGDIETLAQNQLQEHAVVAVSLSSNEDTIVIATPTSVFTISHDNLVDWPRQRYESERFAAISALKSFFESESTIKVFHDLRDASRMARTYADATLKGVLDTQLAMEQRTTTRASTTCSRTSRSPTVANVRFRVQEEWRSS